MTTTPMSTSVMTANALMKMAAQVEADERLLKQKMLACARIRQFDLLVAALEAWLDGPAAEALKRLDPCRGSEVKDKRP